ncbi:hypothetical protein C8J57DRAFT_1291839 [Mycena rebaudengoi]|nr:hypothetical protein C8J57DRAFT_1291839 [Mycena rebaudengoi]
MWEELAFYEGFALTWQAIYTSQGRQDEFVLFCFPTGLGLYTLIPVRPTRPSELDILKLSRQIVQSRYRALCSTVGVKPSNLRASESDTSPEPSSGASRHGQSSTQPVWKIESPGE